MGDVAAKRRRFFISLLFNMAAVAPILTWPFFVPYLADYFMQTTHYSSLTCAQALFALQIGVSCVTEPLVSWMVRWVDCRKVIVLGYSLMMAGTLWALTASDMDAFMILMGLLGQMGASTVAVTSLLIILEWFTPKSRGVLTGFGTGLLLGIASLVILA